MHLGRRKKEPAMPLHKHSKTTVRFCRSEVASELLEHWQMVTSQLL